MYLHIWATSVLQSLTVCMWWNIYVSKCVINTWTFTCVQTKLKAGKKSCGELPSMSWTESVKQSWLFQRSLNVSNPPLLLLLTMLITLNMNLMRFNENPKNCQLLTMGTQRRDCISVRKIHVWLVVLSLWLEMNCGEVGDTAQITERMYVCKGWTPNNSCQVEKRALLLRLNVAEFDLFP